MRIFLTSNSIKNLNVNVKRIFFLTTEYLNHQLFFLMKIVGVSWVN